MLVGTIELFARSVSSNIDLKYTYYNSSEHLILSSIYPTKNRDSIIAVINQSSHKKTYTFGIYITKNIINF